MSRLFIRSAAILALVGLVAVAEPRAARTKLRPMPNTDSRTWVDEPHERGNDPVQAHSPSDACEQVCTGRPRPGGRRPAKLTSPATSSRPTRR